MKTTILTVLLLWVCILVMGQNLVPNPSYEMYTSCPTTASQITYATGWHYSRNAGEYLNSCSSSVFADVPTNYFGFQEAATGEGYVGGLQYGSFLSTYVADVREYFYVVLTSPLEIGTTYYVSFKVSLADHSEYAINNLGLQFITAYDANFPLNNMAHVYTTDVVSDKTNWVTVTGTFVPTVAYSRLLLGNFFDDANTTVTFVGSGMDIGYNAYYFFDDIYVATTPFLAISLTAFSAQNTGGQNLLQWETESEDAGDSFEVERSTDARTFTLMEKVEGAYPTGGHYQLKDSYPADGINYYRLKMISLDGSYTYSKIVHAEVSTDRFMLDAYPNPVHDVLNVRFSEVTDGAATLTITNATGKTVHRQPLSGNTASIPMGNLPAGTYTLHYTDDQVSENIRFIRN